MHGLRDHPVIEALCRTGYPDGKESKEMLCPICGEDAEVFYTPDKSWEIVGCDRCLSTRYYWEFEQER